MGKKKQYKAPELEVMMVESVKLLEASFNEEMQTDKVLTDPEQIL